MFSSPYRYSNLGPDTTLVNNNKNPIRRHLYKFKTESRTYLVSLEVFSFNVAAIKYCDLRDKNNKEIAYKRIFNDGDAFKVITTCLFIMLDFWQHNPSISFAFYAVPRDSELNNQKKKFDSELQRQNFLEKRKNARFNIYEYAMINLFGPQDFLHSKDSLNNIYILANKKQKNLSSVIIQIAKYLLENNDVILQIDSL